jgi:hypothetical protein
MIFMAMSNKNLDNVEVPRSKVSRDLASIPMKGLSLIIAVCPRGGTFTIRAASKGIGETAICYGYLYSAQFF